MSDIVKMKCMFNNEKGCPLSGQNIPMMHMGHFCQACIGGEQIRDAAQSMKVLKAQLIIALLQMFPQDEEKAKQEYQKLMKRVEEW